MFGKATAIGIPFHRGEYGVWNQALLFIFGVGLIFSMTTGWVMVFKRRRKGMAYFPSAGKGAWRAVPLWTLFAFAALLWLAPLLLIGMVFILCMEWILKFCKSR